VGPTTTKEDKVEFFGIGTMYAIVVVGSTLAIAMIARGTTEAMARQPEIAGKVQTIFFVGAGMAEALGILGFVMAILLWTKIVVG
jgi:F-type H+-transporting ATPase subunit c